MAINRDKAADQLKDFKVNQDTKVDNLTTRFGAPIGDKTNVLTVGPRGPLLLQDVQYLEEQANFDRERIPERVVHAKGGGAFGYFEVTKPDIKKYCKAKVFDTVGKKSDLAVRFSTVAGESGSADTVRDPRGFAVKIYTEEGNWDLVGNNTPIFFLRDPNLFPSFIRSQKRNPQTHLKDPDMFWDFISLRPECTHQTAFVFSDRGIPDGFRFMNGYGSHTYKLVNDKDEAFYTKFHWKVDQGIKNLDPEKAHKIASNDPDYALRDLYNAIENKQYPSWTLNVQIMTYEQAKTFKFNPFDMTKVWPHKEYPLIEVGRMVLNRNAKNYFAQIEQMAYEPSNLVPGIEPSPDKMLQGRLFAYMDTHRHRLGANYNQIPVNRPKCPIMHPTERDGPWVYDDNQSNLPNYWPNSFLNTKTNPKYKEHKESISGDVDRHEQNEDYYEQVTDFWNKVLTAEERDRLANNLGGHLAQAQPFIQERAIGNFEKVHPDFGAKIRLAIKKAISANS